MRKLSIIATTLILGLCLQLSQAIAGDVTSLRGNHELNEASKTPVVKHWQDDSKPIMREYVQQPPLIPHAIDKYQITKNHNKCLSCHSWSNYGESGATKISLTHFSDRDGNDLANVSARRYFCNQCHIPQNNVKPLVENTFKPVETLR